MQVGEVDGVGIDDGDRPDALHGQVGRCHRAEATHTDDEHAELRRRNAGPHRRAVGDLLRLVGDVSAHGRKKAPFRELERGLQPILRPTLSLAQPPRARRSVGISTGTRDLGAGRLLWRRRACPSATLDKRERY